jgi:hypothetical protein
MGGRGLGFAGARSNRRKYENRDEGILRHIGCDP